MKPKIHWAGGIKHSHGRVLEGWAACCSGDRCYAISDRGNYTENRANVTCKACMKMLEKHDAWAAMNENVKLCDGGAKTP